MSISLTLNHAAAARPSGSLSRTGVFAMIMDGIREGRAIQARYDALAAMSDTELARWGMTRADILQAALSTGTR